MTLRWAKDDNEKRHVTDTLLKATGTAGQDVNVMMNNGMLKKGRIYQSGTNLSDDYTTNRGYIILENEQGREEIDVLDIKHLQ